MCERTGLGQTSSVGEEPFKFRFSDFCLKDTIWKFEQAGK